MSEHPAEMAVTDGQQPVSLPELPSILVFTMTTDIDGQSSVRYTMPPERAVGLLREVASSIEAEIAEANGREPEGEPV